MTLKRNVKCRAGTYSAVIEVHPDTQEVSLAAIRNDLLDDYLLDEYVDEEDYEINTWTLDEAAEVIEGLREAIEACSLMSASLK